MPPWRMGDVFLVRGVIGTPLLRLNITRVNRLVNLKQIDTTGIEPATADFYVPALPMSYVSLS